MHFEVAGFRVPPKNTAQHRGALILVLRRPTPDTALPPAIAGVRLPPTAQRRNPVGRLAWPQGIRVGCDKRGCKSRGATKLHPVKSPLRTSREHAVQRDADVELLTVPRDIERIPCAVRRVGTLDPRGGPMTVCVSRAP